VLDAPNDNPVADTSDDVENSAPKLVGVPFAKGDDPRRGKGPPKGSGGRPRNEFRERIRDLLNSDKVKQAVQKVIENPDHPQFTALYSKLLVQAHGNPAQQVEHTGEEGGPIEIAVTHEVIDPLAR
jgi:hypothetical protein